MAVYAKFRAVAEGAVVTLAGVRARLTSAALRFVAERPALTERVIGQEEALARGLVAGIGGAVDIILAGDRRTGSALGKLTSFPTITGISVVTLAVVGTAHGRFGIGQTGIRRAAELAASAPEGRQAQNKWE